MTNSQESDSIAEKPEVVKTKFKPKFFLWKKTAFVIALLALTTTASAGFWKEVGKWLVRIYNSSGTIIDVVQLANKSTGLISYIEYHAANSPTNRKATLYASTDDYAETEQKSMYYPSSGSDSPVETIADNIPFLEHGNYEHYEISWVIVDTARTTPSGYYYEKVAESDSLYSTDKYLSKASLESSMNSGSFAARVDYEDIDTESTIFGNRAWGGTSLQWLTNGPWVTTASSFYSEFKNPKLIGQIYDNFVSQLPPKEEIRQAVEDYQNADGTTGITYTSRAHYAVRTMTWLPGKRGRIVDGATYGRWTYGKWRPKQSTVKGIPAWKESEHPLDPNPCGPKEQIRRTAWTSGNVTAKWDSHQVPVTVSVERKLKSGAGSTIVQHGINGRESQWKIWTDTRGVEDVPVN